VHPSGAELQKLKAGFGTRAGMPRSRWMLRNPRRTRPGDSGRPGSLPAGLDGHRVIRRDVPGHGRDSLDARPGNGIGDVVQINEVGFDLQTDRADRRFGERRIT
jgi:hypothetical protein